MLCGNSKMSNIDIKDLNKQLCHLISCIIHETNPNLILHDQKFNRLYGKSPQNKHLIKPFKSNYFIILYNDMLRESQKKQNLLNEEYDQEIQQIFPSYIFCHENIN